MARTLITTPKDWSDKKESSSNMESVQGAVQFANSDTEDFLKNANWTSEEGSDFVELGDNGDIVARASQTTNVAEYTKDSISALADARIESRSNFENSPGQSHVSSVMGRYTDIDNWYRARPFGGGIDNFIIQKNVAGVQSTIASAANVYDESMPVKYFLGCSGTTIEAKDLDNNISLSVADTSHASGDWGLRTQDNPYFEYFYRHDLTNTSGNFIIKFDRGVSPPQSTTLAVTVDKTDEGDGSIASYDLRHADTDVGFAAATVISDGETAFSKIHDGRIFKRFIYVRVNASRTTASEDNNPKVNFILIDDAPDTSQVAGAGTGWWGG